jgi:outer membrane lipoprotein SlyB
MALQVVDIFGNLQPATGRTFPKNSLEIIPYFNKYKTGVGSVFKINPQGTSVSNDNKIKPESYQSLYEFYSPTELLNNGYAQIGDNKYIKTYKKYDRTFQFFQNYFTETYTPKSGGTPKINVFVDLEKYPIFNESIGDRLSCLAQYDSIKSSTLSNTQLGFRRFFNVQAFNWPTVTDAFNYEFSYNRSLNSVKADVNYIFEEIKNKVSSGQLDKKLVPDCFLPDPDPALPGPPTQAINGVANKAPVVDNLNIKLPSQEVKGLDANAAQQAASQAQGAAINAASQLKGGAQESAGGVLSNLSSGVKGAIGGGALGAGVGALAGGGKGALIGAGAGLVAGGIAGSVVDKLNPKGIKPDGLGKDWSPDKFSPESIAGNDKFVNAKTGMVESTSELAKGLKGGLLGGALGAGVGALAGGGKGAIIGAVSGGVVGVAAAKLASVKKGMPKPNIPKPPSVPRIKTVKIPRPSNPKGATDLLNLPKSSLG